MSVSGSSTSRNWYWSQRGITMGPVDFAELRRLVSEGSVTATSWIYNPVQSAWVQASTVPELMDAAPQPSVAPPPDAPLPSTVYCRFCGAAAPANASHCTACGRPMGNAQGFVIDGKTAAIICRASVLATVALPVVAIFAPIILWGIHPNDQAIVREARAVDREESTQEPARLVHHGLQPRGEPHSPGRARASGQAMFGEANRIPGASQGIRGGRRAIAR